MHETSNFGFLMTLVLLRDIGSDDFAQAFMTGIQKNSDLADRRSVTTSPLTFGQAFASIPEFKKGDVVTGDWIPGKGAEFKHNGGRLGDTFPDPLFYAMFLKIWLGDHPADSSLKQRLLGEKEQTSTH